MRTKVTQNEIDDAISTLKFAIGTRQLQVRAYGQNEFVNNLYITGLTASAGEWAIASQYDNFGDNYYTRPEYNQFIVVDQSLIFEQQLNEAQKKLNAIRKKELQHIEEVKKVESEVKYLQELVLQKKRE